MSSVRSTQNSNCGSRRVGVAGELTILIIMGIWGNLGLRNVLVIHLCAQRPRRSSPAVAKATSQLTSRSCWRAACEMTRDNTGCKTRNISEDAEAAVTWQIRADSRRHSANTHIILPDGAEGRRLKNSKVHRGARK
jgi:hypothetical protein